MTIKKIIVHFRDNKCRIFADKIFKNASFIKKIAKIFKIHLIIGKKCVKMILA